MRVVIDTGRCLGNALCVSSAPEVFDVDDDGTAFLLQEEPGPEHADRIELAVRRCPTGALSLQR